ncbi:unnamed protein product [Musa hybrid cultivar]
MSDMGKRLRRDSGRSPTSFSAALLRRRIASSKVLSEEDGAFIDVDVVVQRLRSLYPDYSRVKLQPFTLHVRKTLDSFSRRPSSATAVPDDDDSDEGTRTSLASAGCSRRTPGRSEAEEKRLLRAESEHLRRRIGKRIPVSNSSDDDSATSSTDDSVFEAKVEPEFDLMKSMLRDSYGKGPKRVDKEERNVEMEVEKPRNMQPVVDGGSGVETPMSVEKGSSGGGSVMVDDVREQGPRFRDLGGMKPVLEELMMEVIVPLCHPELPQRLGVRPMAGILLHGPPGCGKTKLAHAIANETGAPFYKISATEIVSGVSGASEENIRDLFKKAYRTAPSIVFIDEIDAIASKRENLQREMERRIVTQLMTCMDESHQSLRSTDTNSEPETSDRKPGYVLVIGATNRPDAVDQALRRPGRFDREIVLGVPDENARLEILSVLTRKLKLEGQFNLFKIARSTPGFVGADLAALVNKAGNLAMKRIIDKRRSQISCELKEKDNDDWWRQPWDKEEVESLSITMVDFEEAVKMVQPSSRREGFSSIPNVTWEDVGGLTSLRKEFDRYIVQRVKHPEAYEEFGVNLEAGFLLYGPPGCGKTLIAKAVANEAGANFIHIKGPELLNKYVGESELAVRTIFSRARTCSPCILFFDEVDALTTKRGREGGWVVERLLNQLLIELDGADRRQGVYVIGATNRPEVMDPAVLRPGRFGKVLYVPLPSSDERQLILKALAQKKPISADVDLEALACTEQCNNLTGADLAALMNEAAMAALEEKQDSIDQGIENINPWLIKTSHFEHALQKIKPSVSEKERKNYEELSRKLGAS